MLLAFCVVPRRGCGGGTIGTIAVDMLLRSMVQMVATGAIAVTAGGNANAFGPTSGPMPWALWRHTVGSIPCPHGLIITFAPSRAGLSR